MKIEKRDVLKNFMIYYNDGKKQFYGTVTVNNGEFEIKATTEYFESPEEALKELKELLVKAYLKADTKIKL